MKETEFVIQLGTVDRIREIHARNKHDNWLVVIRYDSSHGFAHRDQYDVRGRSIKTALLALDYNQALTFAEFDLKANWQVYRERFFKGE